MFLRVTAAKGHRYVQLVHNYRDPETGTTRTRVLYSFGREDQLDVAAMQRLVQSICRVIATADSTGTGLASIVGTLSEFSGSRELGAVWVLDQMWHELGLAQAVRLALGAADASPSPGERWLFAAVAATALCAQATCPLETWVREQAFVPGLALDTPCALLPVTSSWGARLLADLERHIFAALGQLADSGTDPLFVGTVLHELTPADADRRVPAPSPAGAAGQRDAEGLPLLVGLVLGEDGLARYGWAEPAERRPVPPLERVKAAFSAYTTGAAARTLVGYERRLTSLDAAPARETHGEDLIIVDQLVGAEKASAQTPPQAGIFARRPATPEIRQMSIAAGGGRRRVTIVYNSPLPTGSAALSPEDIAGGLSAVSASSTAVAGFRPPIAPLAPGADLPELVKLHGLVLWLALVVTQRAALLAGMDWAAIAAIAIGLKAGVHKTAAGTLWQSSTPAAAMLDLLQSLGAEAPPRFLKVLPNP